MNTMKIVTLLAAVLLTAAEVVVLDIGAQQRVASYRAEAAAALPARG